MQEVRKFDSPRLHSCSVFELGHGEDSVEGRPVLLMAEPAAFHVQAFEHGGVEQLAGPVAAAPVAGGTTRREPEGEFHHVLPVVEARVEDALTRLGGPQLGTDALLLAPEHGDEGHPLAPAKGRRDRTGTGEGAEGAVGGGPRPPPSAWPGRLLGGAGRRGVLLRPVSSMLGRVATIQAPVAT